MSVRLPSAAVSTAWLDPLRAGVPEALAPVTFFFRDDNAGWDDRRLFALLDRFDEHALPLDLAVIPAATEEPLARDPRAAPPPRPPPAPGRGGGARGRVSGAPATPPRAAASACTSTATTTPTTS